MVWKSSSRLFTFSLSLPFSFVFEFLSLDFFLGFYSGRRGIRVPAIEKLLPEENFFKGTQIGEYKSEMNCQPACYICHNQRWSPQKKDKVILDPRPFPLLCLKKKQYKENQAIKKQGLLKIRLFNKERALEESKRGLIY